MPTRTRSLLLALLFIVGSALEASATLAGFPSLCNCPLHDWTFQAGGRRFGFFGYGPLKRDSKTNYTTIVYYGFGEFDSNLPVHVVVACGTLPLLVCTGFFIFRSRHKNTAEYALHRSQLSARARRR